MQAGIDAVIENSLQSFYQDISSPDWCGREREMISLFAFGHFARHCIPNSSLSLNHIGIEVAVKQLPRNNSHPGRRSTVCKDFVIWPQPNMTLWNSERQVHFEPIAIMEWKVNHHFSRNAHSKNRGENLLDIEWLQKKSISVPDLIGYAVFAESTRTPKELICARIQNGNVDAHWLVLGA
jgi:hypothetical protein